MFTLEGDDTDALLSHAFIFLPTSTVNSVVLRTMLEVLKMGINYVTIIIMISLRQVTVREFFLLDLNLYF